jgi:transketolase
MSTVAEGQKTQALPRARAHETQHLEQLARLIRYYTLAATAKAGSGHPSSSLSATDLMVGLLFGGTFRYEVDRPENPNNDRLIFSKGHASPLFYALWLAAGKVTEEEMLSYRIFGSSLEGHPTPVFRFCEAATGSLGQGLSIGVGMALYAKRLARLPYRTYVLLGDSEMAEGSQWEALQLAAWYKLDNLVGVLDVNRLGQRGETMYGHDLGAYEQRVAAFGWKTLCIDGHSLSEIVEAYRRATSPDDRPTMIIARTIKGKGVARIEDKNGWHGKPLDPDDSEKAIKELGNIDKSVRGVVPKPEDLIPQFMPAQSFEPPLYDLSKKVATRTAYGSALKRIAPGFPQIVSLDGEVSNSTRADEFQKAYPDRFLEMYIAEQNMVGAALGLSRRGAIPFVSTFAAFLTRACDQIRMARYSNGNIKFVGSHAGVSIGEDGPSQMGLEDIAMFRAVLGSVVLHPCDAIATEKLVEEMARHTGISYLRTMRQNTPIIHDPSEEFPIGGSKTLRESPGDRATVIAAGATVHEALKAYDRLKEQGIKIRVIDAYSIKPIDRATLLKAARETGRIITVEDHYAEGGLGEAVLSAMASNPAPVHLMAVRTMPKSGKPDQLIDYEEISADAIITKIKEIVS